MISKTKIKYLNSLKQKKNRILHQSFIVESHKNVLDLLNSNYEILELFATRNWIEKNNIKKPIIVHKISSKDMQRISSLKNASDVLILVKMPVNNKKFNFSGVNIALEDIKDPGNLGTIIRICDWFGVKNIFCSYETVDAYNPKVVQSSMGSISRVRVIYTDLYKLIQKAPSNVNIYSTVIDGENINKIILDQNSIIIFGNEGTGISSKMNSLIHNKIGIKRVGKAESLNVAISSAIILNKFCN